MNTKKIGFLRAAIEKLTMGIPYFIIAGILDYRFHSFYYLYVNVIRPLTGQAFFDFFSIFDFYIWGASLLLIIVLFKNLKKNVPTIKVWLQDPFLAVSLLLFITGGLTAIFSYNPTEPIIHSFKSYVNTNYVTPFLTALLLSFTLNTKEKIRTFFKHFIFAFSLLGAATLFEYATDLLPGVSHDFLNRAVWPYIDPFVANKPESANWLSYLFSPLFILSLYFLCEREKKYMADTILYISGILIGLSVIVASKSYAGLGAAAFVTFLYLFKKIPTLKRKVGLIVMGIVFITGFLYTQKDSQKMQILLGNYKKENSIERRIQIYSVTLKMLHENIFTGFGPGNFQSAFRQSMPLYLEKPIPEDEVPPHPHNILLQFWSELGISGLIFIVIIYCYTLFSWCKKSLTAPGYLVMSYILIHGLVDVPFGLQEASTLFFIVWAAVVIFHRQRRESSIDAHSQFDQNGLT